MAPLKPRRSVERILVIHTAFLGDIILATPFLAALRKEFPQAEIQMLTTPGGVGLLSPNPWNVTPLAFHKRGSESGFFGLLQKGKELRSFRPDLVFSLHRSLRSTILAKLSGGEIWGFREAAASFFFHGRVSRKSFLYEAEKNLAVLQDCLGTENYSPFPQLAISEADVQSAEVLLAGQEKFIVLAPSSVWATKRWPADRFGRLALRVWRELGLRSVIIGGEAPEDQAAAALLVKTFCESGTEDGLPLNLSGSTSLGTLKSVLCQAQLVVSNDSSPLHMAIAVGVKTLGIFGPTTVELGFFPLAPKGRAGVAEVSGLSCRPCGLHGHRSCPQGHFRCMLELSEDQVFQEVKKLLCP